MIPEFSPRGPQLAEGRLRLPRPLWQHQIHFSTVRHRWSGLRRSVFRFYLVVFVIKSSSNIVIWVYKQLVQSFINKFMKVIEEIRIVKWIMRWWLFSEKCHGAEVSWPPSGFAQSRWWNSSENFENKFWKYDFMSYDFISALMGLKVFSNGKVE